jgi:predicted AAA+ superfamily ATPase
MSLIIGPRQAGKTTLMLQLKDYLEKQGERTLFLNLDFEQDKPFFASQTALLSRMRLEFGKKKGYVFIDEIQRKENAGIFLKGIYDFQIPHKLIISGSGSVELKEKIHESLTGRKRIFELNTVSFKEFVNFRTEYRYEDRLPDFFSVEAEKAKAFLIEYLNFGGYPRVILADTLQEKIRLIDEIYSSYIEKDISYLLRVEKTDVFRNLVKVIASQIGGMVNLTELSSTLGISIQTVKNYLMYAEKTFIIKRVTPYYSNIRKEISKAPILYFMDLGLRNYSLGLFGKITLFTEMGFLFQNLIFHILREKWRYEGTSIHFWRTKDRAEVDFVINIGKDVFPVEVKCREFKEATIGRPLRNFIDTYKPKEAWIVNLTFRKEITINHTLVKFIPFFDLIWFFPQPVLVS